MLTTLVIEYIFFSWFGWVIDTIYRNISSEILVLAPLFMGPFAPVYGIAIVIAHLILKFTKKWKAVWRIGTLSISMTVLEYVSAAFCDKVLGFKLWNYDNSFMNLHGYIDLAHSLEWVVVMIIFYYLVYPTLEKLEKYLTKKIPKRIDLLVLIITLAVMTLLTFTRTAEWRTLYPSRNSDSEPCGYCTPLKSIFTR